MGYQALRGKHLLLADNEAEVREGWCARLTHLGLRITTCAHSTEVQTILADQAATFDAAVVDLKDMGSTREFADDLPTLTRTYRSLPFLILSSDDTLAWKFLKETNVRGYVLKIDQAEGLCTVLEHVLIGGKTGVYSPSVQVKNRLSPSQLQVLKLLAREGLTQRAIAEQLHVSANTVEDHCRAILDRLTPDDRRSMNHAVYIATRARLI